MHSEPIPAEGAGAIKRATPSEEEPRQRHSLGDDREGARGGNAAEGFTGLARGRGATALAERAVLFQLLGNEHEERWELSELEAVLSDLPGCAIAVAIERLARHGVIVRGEDHVAASACARHLDALGMVAL
ncbi:MAG: hypothetical protein ACYCU0_06905 [Solirubrobacteraceae bacterium]